MSGNPSAGGLIGQLAVARGYVTPEQLRQCLELHARDGNVTRLGDILVAAGLVDAGQLQALLNEQAAMLARARETGPTGKAPADAQQVLLQMQSNASSLGRVQVARKSPAEIEAERAKKPGAPAKPAHTGNIKEGPEENREIDIDFSDDSSSASFEIETQGETREIATPARPIPAVTKAPAAAPPAAPPAVAAPATVRAPEPSPIVGVAAPVRGVVDPLSTPGGKMIADLVVASARASASDLHLHPGYPLMIRQHGKIVTSPGVPLKAEQLSQALTDLLGPEQRSRLEKRGFVETTLVVPNVARCRVQISMGAEGLAAIFRVVPPMIPNLAALGLPSTLARLVTGQGLVVIAGPAGCGKTWTLAALVDIVNAERREHIVCIERPIEFLHVSKRCSVSQREVPTHAATTSRAVKAALREDPDVLVIGEIEDTETVKLAITAAESGRLVLATIAAGSATRAVSRILGMFPSEAQAQAGSMLADALRGVVGQRLVSMADGVRRMPICEVLDVNAAAAEKIQSGIPHELQPTIPFDKSLADAVRAGAITREEARRHADRPEPFA